MYQFLVTEFTKLNEKVPNIHYGGCCVFAEELYHFLVKLGKKPRIIAMTGYAKYLEKILAVRIEHAGIFDIKHTVILCDGWIIDNNGIYKRTDEVLHCDHNNYTCFELTLDELKWMNTEVGGWNRKFDRNQIKDIAKTLKKIAKNLVVTN